MELWQWIVLIVLVAIVLFIIWWWWTRMRSTPAAPMTPRMEPRMEPRSAPPAETMAAPAVPMAPAAPAPMAPAPSMGSDKLEVIEGIGPKIAGVLKDAGIGTFAALAATDVMRLEGILRDANLPLAKPGTWPAQAQLAADGKWDELKAMQDSLKGGR
jgi:predicted flap endonuclease-1-like 5' DNA nuclease